MVGVKDNLIVGDYGVIECISYTPTWITLEEYHNRTGKDWPLDWPVYALYLANDGTKKWCMVDYADALKSGPVELGTSLHQIVCALESGKPPKDLRLDNEGEKI
jgi:hypothetical protein